MGYHWGCAAFFCDHLPDFFSTGQFSGDCLDSQCLSGNQNWRWSFDFECGNPNAEKNETHASAENHSSLFLCGDAGDQLSFFKDFLHYTALAGRNSQSCNFSEKNQKGRTEK